MFSPVGSQPPSVYWRRRIIVVGATVLLLVLIVLTLRAAFGSDTTPVAGGRKSSASSRPSTTASTTDPPPSTASSSRSRSGSSTAPHPSSGSPSASSLTPEVLLPCTPAALSVQAVAGRSAYQVGAQPMVELQVTNTGSTPCTQDLADRQVELKVYNGESRVWGSHDCEIKPGTDVRTLAVNSPVRVTITWSGFTSRPGCAGTRQRVGVGSYTLYAVLSGRTGKAAQFSIG